ncbi:MAG TPA: SCO family protein [Niabella sp.]|nr:SCO family protein [Chitinophagaceae bacterium]HRO83396.1 SCO family protein [Niabella sp.]
MKYWQLIYLLTVIWIFNSGFRLPEEKKFLGSKIPDISLIDAQGKNVNLYSLLQGKPLIISPIYTKCPSICGVVSNGTKEAVEKLGTLGKDFNMISFSFDSTDQASDLQNYQRRWKMDGNHWRTVTSDANTIRSLMASVGFEYDVDTTLKQFNHAAMLVVITPEGRISRYIYGVSPSKRDIRLAVMAAMAEKTTPGLFAGLYLRCFGYDPVMRTYKVDWRFIISTSAGLMMIIFMSSIFIKSFIISKPEHEPNN